MKEQFESQSFGEATQSYQRKYSVISEPKAKKAQKTRLIHKEKTTQVKDQQLKQEKIKLTKEERARIQKEKNREAAQRSRDMHKQYVSNLEREVQQLREQIARNRRYCHRCQHILNSEEPQLESEPTFPSTIDNSENALTEESYNFSESGREYNEPESFLRILEPHEESSIIKMMLMVCMIAIAVMVGFNTQPKASEPRTLVQVYNVPPSEPLKVQLDSNGKCPEEKGLVELQRGLQNQNCLDSLMRVESPLLRRSLRSIHQNGYEQEMESIMLCSVKTPEMYQMKPEITDSPIVRLFVAGSEIKDLISRSNPLMSLLDRQIQLNGIYRLSAEIKSVDLVSHHKCIL